MTKHSSFPYLLVLPSLVFFGCFFVFPIAYMVYLSLFDWNFVTPTMNFVALENFKTLFADARFRQVVVNTVIYTVLTVGLTQTLSLLLAVALNKNEKIYTLTQTAIFSPYIISLVSISMLWMWMMDVDYGLLNYVLHLFGLKEVAWITDPNVALYSLVLISVWKSIGYYTLIFIAGLQSIPKYIHEAAIMDNTSPARKFIHITLPMLSPTIFFTGITSLIACFKVFETIAIMTQGGPANATNTFVYFIYEYGFKFFKIGYASAAGVVLLGIVSVLTVIYFKTMAKRVYYQ
ncbi:sugar ABC transporter permease [Peptoniphilus equinus]|uniref:Sugar ABC transporter permease n=1 Tax=Peptoniphilus equinus TaxID=3016343 RepID=A0ABY7QT57_9FIRM|nr:sugar ABC transporter permease [Peptoniphilus equinus]WBW49917.1 sugar ABC transporter permease [Peptoniphilus equinus]